jgi:hypothetical protein
MIPDYFRSQAKQKAKILLDGVTDESRRGRIINQIAEEEWERDRAEWKAWMNGMKHKFNRKYHNG